MFNVRKGMSIVFLEYICSQMAPKDHSPFLFYVLVLTFICSEKKKEKTTQKFLLNFS